MVLDRVASTNGTLRALCRVQPKDPGAVAEARRCLDAGASGIKLHPRAEQFTLSEPVGARPRGRRARAPRHRPDPRRPRHPGARAGHRAPGRGVPGRAADPRPLRDLRPRRGCGASCRACPNVFIDTAWWNPADIIAHVLAVPAGQRRVGERLALRPAAGRRDADDALRAPGRAVAPSSCAASWAAQMERMLDGEDPLDLGPAPGPTPLALDPLLDRVVSHLTTTMGRAFARVDFSEPLALSRLACAVGDDSHVAPICARGARAARRLRRAPRARPRTGGRSPPPGACWCSR